MSSPRLYFAHTRSRAGSQSAAAAALLRGYAHVANHVNGRPAEELGPKKYCVGELAHPASFEVIQQVDRC